MGNFIRERRKPPLGRLTVFSNYKITQLPNHPILLDAPEVVFLLSLLVLRIRLHG